MYNFIFLRKKCSESPSYGGPLLRLSKKEKANTFWWIHIIRDSEKLSSKILQEWTSYKLFERLLNIKKTQLGHLIAIGSPKLEFLAKWFRNWARRNTWPQSNFGSSIEQSTTKKNIDWNQTFIGNRWMSWSDPEVKVSPIGSWSCKKQPSQETNFVDIQTI